MAIDAWRRAAGVILLAVCGFAAGVGVGDGPANRAQAQGGRVPTVICACGFRLEDENGKTRAMLGADKDRPGLSLHDENGSIRAWLKAVKDRPGLTLSDENGKIIWRTP